MRQLCAHSEQCRQISYHKQQGRRSHCQCQDTRCQLVCADKEIRILLDLQKLFRPLIPLVALILQRAGVQRLNRRTESVHHRKQDHRCGK